MYSQTTDRPRHGGPGHFNLYSLKFNALSMHLVNALTATCLVLGGHIQDITLRGTVTAWLVCHALLQKTVETRALSPVPCPNLESLELEDVDWSRVAPRGVIEGAPPAPFLIVANPLAPNCRL